jgi:catecholate siderophore receptor
MKVRVLALCVLCAAVAALPAPAAAQGATAVAIQGVVVDPMQAPIAGAEVTIAGAAGPAQTVRTDGRGSFIVHVAAGTYSVTATAPGFAPVAATVVTRSGEQVAPRFVLPISGVHEAVTVNAPRGYGVPAITSATRTPTPLRDVPQSVTVVSDTLIKDQLMGSMADVMHYVPGVSSHQGENNRDQIIIRGNSSSADFFVDGVRDDVQYYRDLYNLDRIEVLKGPNALAFGRGGAGGVVNQVVKEARFQPSHEMLLQGGTFGNKRVTADLDQPLSDAVAFRLNAVLEDSDSFRNDVGLSRGGINPTFTIRPTDRTRVTASYEFLRDRRVADRGITSFRGRPVDVPSETYFGDPDQSHVSADVNIGSVGVEHQFHGLMLRNRTQVAGYSRSYQNFVPGAVSSDAMRATLTAYNNATDRTNVFNQTDVTIAAHTGEVAHTLLAGAEFGGQFTDNFRNTGFFNDSSTSLQVPLANPRTTVPVTFRQSATDADNHLRTRVAAAFVQDQIVLSPAVQLLAGVRVDRFDLEYHNNRTGDTLERPDTLVSPRAGIVIKPVQAVSLYGSYSVSYLPSSGDQFSSLTTITQQVKPERFNNYEVGTKWDARPGLAVNAALYRLDRTNTRSTDPNDPTRIIQTGSQRTNGVEFGITGAVAPRWTMAGGYAYQDAFVSSATASAVAGALVAQVPHHTFSLWNTVRLQRRVSAGLGLIQRSDMFAAIDNTVVLPGYLRADAAAYFTLNRRARIQLNVENLAGTAYYINADSNTNVSPGPPRTVRVALITRF